MKESGIAIGQLCRVSSPHSGAAPLRWTVSRLLSLILSPSILHPKRSLPPQAAEALGGFFLQSAENRPHIKLQAPRSRSTPGVGIPGNSLLRELGIHDHAASLAGVNTLVVHRRAIA